VGPDSIELLVSAIYNAGWLVRHYARGGRLRASCLSEQRAQAIRDLGLVIRRAFNSSDNFEALLTALFDALNKSDDPPF